MAIHIVLGTRGECSYPGIVLTWYQGNEVLWYMPSGSRTGKQSLWC